MISIQSPEVKQRIASWQSELRGITGDETIKLVPTSNPEVILSLEDITEVVVYATGVPYEKICSKTRKRGIVLARHLVCYFAYKKNVISWREIGLYLGGRDHTSAMNGHSNIKDYLETGDKATVQFVGMISQYLEELKIRIAKAEDIS